MNFNIEINECYWPLYNFRTDCILLQGTKSTTCQAKDLQRVDSVELMFWWKKWNHWLQRFMGVESRDKSIITAFLDFSEYRVSGARINVVVFFHRNRPPEFQSCRLTHWLKNSNVDLRRYMKLKFAINQYWRQFLDLLVFQDADAQIKITSFALESCYTKL